VLGPQFFVDELDPTAFDAAESPRRSNYFVLQFVGPGLARSSKSFRHVSRKRPSSWSVASFVAAPPGVVAVLVDELHWHKDQSGELRNLSGGGNLAKSMFGLPSLFALFDWVGAAACKEAPPRPAKRDGFSQSIEISGILRKAPFTAQNTALGATERRAFGYAILRLMKPLWWAKRYLKALRHPAASASSAVQNQRLP
jgi:hypothetical protein